MFANALASSAPSARSAPGAIRNPPPNTRAFATTSMSSSRRTGASPSAAISTGKPGKRWICRRAQ